jgi:hypothetical protein
MAQRGGQVRLAGTHRPDHQSTVGGVEEAQRDPLVPQL